MSINLIIVWYKQGLCNDVTRPPSSQPIADIYDEDISIFKQSWQNEGRLCV